MIKCCFPAKAPKIAVEFNNNNVDNSDYFTTSTFNNVVRSQVGNFFIMHENIRSFGFFFYEFHTFASELNRAADVQNAVLKKRHEVTQTDISSSIGGIKTSSPKLLVLPVTNIIVPC